jgi:hypothetical protein
MITATDYGLSPDATGEENADAMRLTFSAAKLHAERTAEPLSGVLVSVFAIPEGTYFVALPKPSD